MNGRFSEEPKEPSASIKMHKNSGSKPEHILIFAHILKSENWPNNERLVQYLRLIKLKFMFMDSPLI